MSRLYTDSNEFYGVTISSDGATVDYVDPTEGPKTIPDITNNANSFLRVNSDATNIEWTDLSGGGGIPIGQVNLGLGSVTNPSLTFQGDTDTGIYSQNANEITLTTGGVQRLKADNSVVEVGTAINNCNFNVNGNSSATNFRAGNGTTANPSYSFTTSNGQDCGMYYNFSGNDQLVFSVNGSQMLNLGISGGTSTLSNKLLLTGGSSTNPVLALNSTAFSTGFSGDTSNNLWTLTNGVINTTHSTTGFNVGQLTSNNTLTRTLNANGPSNFNTFTPSYSSFLLPQTTIGTITQSLSGVDFDGTNYIVSVSGTSAGARLFVSSNLSTWTTISDTQIALGNSQVQYGNGIWCYLSRVPSQTLQLWTSTAPATTWTQISGAPWTTSASCNRIKFVNGQFIVLMANSGIRFSSNGTTWTSYTANATSYNLQDITYSPELQRYVIVCGNPNDVVLYFSGNTITNTSIFTAVTTGVERSIAIAYSSKLSMFLFQTNTSPWLKFFYSRDGISWTSYTNPTTTIASNNLIWINDFGGFFLNMQFNNNNLAISRDGLSFQLVANNLSLNSINCVYNSTGKVLVIVGSSGIWGCYRNLLTDFNNYVDSDNIYNTFNSNTRFTDIIEYQPQNITTATGNNHFPVTFFNRSVVIFDTASVNANIYLQGSSFNGRVGYKIKFIKSNSNNNVRLHGYETTTLISPTGNVSSFNAQSSPQTYSIIPAGYFGSFELTRISDTSNGVWIVDNVDVYNSAGTHRDISNLSVAGNLSVDGTINFTGGLDFVGNPRLSSTELRSVNVIDADINVPHFIGAYCGKTLPTPASNINIVTLKNLGVNGVGKTFYWFRSTGDVLNECRFTNDSGQDAYVFYWDKVNNREEFFLLPNSNSFTTHTATTNYSFSWWKFTYMEVANFRRWIVKEIGSSWE